NSDKDGAFLITQLPPGNYELTAEADGFNSSLPLHFDLVLGTTLLVNVTMRVSVTDIVEVHAGDIVFDANNTQSSVNVDRARIDNLPINRRNFLDFSLTAPRVVSDGNGQGAAASSGLSFNGQNSRFNNITIDGLDNNDSGSGSVRATFSQD